MLPTAMRRIMMGATRSGGMVATTAHRAGAAGALAARSISSTAARANEFVEHGAPAPHSYPPEKAATVINICPQGRHHVVQRFGKFQRVETGGLQMMQTGSGVSHEERTFDVPTNFFQIWFEPHLGDTVKRL